MERKKELKQLYKETAVKAGIYQIENQENGKKFIGSTKNLKTLNGVKFMLENDTHLNKELQSDWKLFGKEAFEFKVLEELKEQTDPMANPKKELERLEEKWLNELEPYDGQGYNSKKK